MYTHPIIRLKSTIKFRIVYIRPQVGMLISSQNTFYLVVHTCGSGFRESSNRNEWSSKPANSQQPFDYELIQVRTSACETY
jgi:hypothetical protein